MEENTAIGAHSDVGVPVPVCNRIANIAGAVGSDIVAWLQSDASCSLMVSAL